ncbi:hypothetical protein OKW28_004334 [Paraburkholderia sp. 40]
MAAGVLPGCAAGVCYRSTADLRPASLAVVRARGKRRVQTRLLDTHAKLAREFDHRLETPLFLLLVIARDVGEAMIEEPPASRVRRARAGGVVRK